MLDHILGRPSPQWKRTQVFLVIVFWLVRLLRGDPRGPKLGGVRRLNALLVRYTPYQIVLTTLTALYAVRHLDYVLGLGAPEPLSRLYSRSYYRATWIATAFDAGFATAMNIRPKWFRNICEVLFSGYYIIYANEADEKLRKFRAVATVEMLRCTWEKAMNPYLRAFTRHYRPSLPFARRFFIPRPSNPPSAKHTSFSKLKPQTARSSLPPIEAFIFFDGTEAELAAATDVVLDFPGGGFISMGPEHHEERLRRWARKFGRDRDVGENGGRKRVVVSIDYGKSPEYPYPWAIEECFDTYVSLVQSKGQVLGLKNKEINIILCGDSAGANIVTTVMLKILESPTYIQRPVALVLSYAALDFNFTSWMSPAHLRVLRTEQSSAHIPGIEGKDHLAHRSPLAVVEDVEEHRRLRRKKSWTQSLSSKLPFAGSPTSSTYRSLPSPSESRFPSSIPRLKSSSRLSHSPSHSPAHSRPTTPPTASKEFFYTSLNEEDYYPLREQDKPLLERVKTPGAGLVAEEEDPLDLEGQQIILSEQAERAQTERRRSGRGRKRAPIGTRLTMTSRSGYFQDRIIPPTMMRAMAILYLGPSNCPDFETDYYVSPILAPSVLLARFPPVLMICGEKDPFVDDTVIFAGRIREAKRARKAEAIRALEHRSPGGRSLGETLRMSNGRSGSVGGAGNGAGGRGVDAKVGKMDDPILEEEEEDWVTVHYYEGWGHGFLQMAALMKEIDQVLCEMADWIGGAFERDREGAAATEGEGGTPAMGGTRDPSPAAVGERKAAGKGGVQLSPGGDGEPLSFTTKRKTSTTSPEVPASGGVPLPAHIESTTAADASLLSVDTGDSSSSSDQTHHQPLPPPRSLPAILAAALSRSTTPSSHHLPTSNTSSTTSSTAAGSSQSAPTTTVSTPPILSSHPSSSSNGTSTPKLSSISGRRVPLDEQELMRRRRSDAVFGLGETVHAVNSGDGEGEGEGEGTSEAGGSEPREGSSVDLAEMI